MADEEDRFCVTKLSQQNPIGYSNNYVGVSSAVSVLNQTTIEASGSSDQDSRVQYSSNVYYPIEITVDEEDLTGEENTDFKTSSYLPRLAFLDSDENISSNRNASDFRELSQSELELNNIDDEPMPLRSDSDCVINNGLNGLTPLLHQGNNCTNQDKSTTASQQSLQSSNSSLLMDHYVDKDQTEVEMALFADPEKSQIQKEKWHCHLHNGKIPPDKMARNQLITVSVLCFLFMVGESIGGFLSNSLALFTDVLHLGSDLISFLVSLLALYLSRKPATRTMSFGYHRAEVLGALVSVFIIWSVTGVLIYMAVERIINEHYKDVKADEMLITAILGVVFNFVMGIVLHSELCCKGSAPSFGHNHSHGSHDSHHHSNHINHNNHSNGPISRTDEDREPLLENDEDDLIHVHGSDSENNNHNTTHPKNINVRAAFIHVVGDIIQSIGVLISSLIIKLKPEEKYRLADPICTFMFSILVLLTTITVLRDTLQIIMEGVPRGFNYFTIKNSLQNIDGVKSVHGLSLWCLTLEKNALAVHLAVGPEVNHKRVLQEASEFLHRNYSFLHTTIQVEDYTSITAQCPDCIEIHK